MGSSRRRCHYARAYCPRCRTAIQSPPLPVNLQVELLCGQCGAWLPALAAGPSSLMGVPKAPQVRLLPLPERRP